MFRLRVLRGPMMLDARVEFKDLVADAAEILVGPHGFTRAGRRFGQLAGAGR